jgi:hypothetical protein
MMCALSNARSAIPACAFRSLSKRDSYAVLDKRYLRVVASDTRDDTRERGRFVFTEQSLIRRSSPITFMHSPNFFRPAALNLPMWSRPAMLGSIRKRASVWRGPVRSSSLSFVSSRGPAAALHPLGQNCKSDCAAGATRLLRSCTKKFLAQIPFLEMGS